jgi:hypothetical protein
VQVNRFAMKGSSVVGCCANRVFVWLERISRRKTLMCLLVMAMTMAVRIALLPRIPIPKPYVADEFSYVLGAETFASGKLTNPVHPMWEHFETFHEIMRPTYMSMYPPGQALFLAFGWKLLGHPWFGVWASFGLFAACLCWMLQNWVPPVYAVIGTTITLARISVFGYWMNSYWGGTVAAIGGCLLLGALPRLVRAPVKSKNVFLAAIGLLLLANTRPYEGLIMSTGFFLALLFLRMRQRQPLRELLSLRCLIPLLLVCGAGGLLDGYYNYRVTGNAFLMPYAVYFQDYRIAPPLIIFPERTPPVYRHANLENSWRADLEHFRKVKAHLIVNLTESRVILIFYYSLLFVFPVLLGIFLSSSYRLRTAVAICCFVWLGLLIEYAKTPHYIAGSVGLFAVLAVYGLRLLRVIGGSYGPVLMLTLAALMCMQGKASEQGQSWETRAPRFMSPRMIAMRKAMEQGGQHLILVRYSADHIDKSDECVYNAADIDASQIVWAQDMGEAKNRELINYYHGNRKVWMYQPDTDPTKLIPYESASQ